MPRPVCVRCCREMDATRSGAVSFYAQSVGPRRPYQQYQGDQFTCPGCGASVIARYGDRPTFEHFHTGEPEGAIAISLELVPEP